MNLAYLNSGGKKKTHLKFIWHNKLRSIHSHKNIYCTKDKDGQDDGKVTDEFSHLRGRETDVDFFSFWCFSLRALVLLTVVGKKGLVLNFLRHMEVV